MFEVEFVFVEAGDLAPHAADQFAGLDPHVQDRIVTKLDEVVDSEWRDPSDFLEPLTGGPFSKLRIGQYRLACIRDSSQSVLEVHRIEHRSGAYTADD
ncbi:toxin [Halostagnicola sp. A56]|uniref:type II toxin-antitoxin system RelE family toxin n=1 Tax=Halostagnicola sp. A56 TaxID=1495067 RepID=UPI0009E5293F